MLADTIFALKVGEVAGPFKIGDYFSIVQLIGKKERKQKSLSEARLEIEKELEWQWKHHAAQAALDTKKTKVPVVIFDNRLQAFVL